MNRLFKKNEIVTIPNLLSGLRILILPFIVWYYHKECYTEVIILFKSIKREIRLAVHPRSTHKITMNGRSIETQTVQAVNAYLAVYCAIFALSLLIVSINGYDYTTNFTAVLATLNNIGPGLELVGPTSNFAFFSPISKLVLILDMLIGRLEIFPMLILFSSYARRK